MTPATKFCRDCSTDKPTSDFSRNRAKSDGLQDYCKGCFLVRARRVRERRRAGLIPVVVPASKTCTACLIEKPASEFSRNATLPTGLYWFCKACTAERARRRKYGLEPEQHAALVSSQNGRCAICRRKQKLLVDHCHQTGQVRGLLCGPCNTAIGMLDDDPDLLIAAAAYVRAAVREEVAACA